MANSESITLISILVNGDAAQLDAPATIANLVELRAPRPPFAVELNKQLVRRGDYNKVSLNDGDRVEIVTLVGGG